MTEANTSATTFDVAVIGGGINGVGIAQDLALRGLSVLLLEKDDFASHTTGASTKLIHGGLRYLEYMEFSLVRESLRERETLLRNAPHLVRPLRMDIPVYKSSKRSFPVVEAGMILYDLLSYDKSLPRHHFVYGAEKLKRRLPSLKHEGLKALTAYYDCQALLPERLCLEVALSAAEAGARLLNGHALIACRLREGLLNELTVLNRATGGKERYRARLVVNAAGIFVDKVLGLVGDDFPRKMGGTKGSHLLLPRFDGGPENALYIEAIQDGRPFFIIPWYHFYLVGTTDIFYDGDLDEVSASEAEVDYLLYELNHWLKGGSFTREDVVYSYSGIRPLPYEPGEKESRVTRRHIILDHARHGGPANLISIIGGKLTTYRGLAEECGDLVCDKLNHGASCGTEHLPLPGAAGVKDFKVFRESRAVPLAERYGVELPVAEALLDMYGARAEKVLILTRERPEWKERLNAQPLTIKAQVAFAVKREFARDITDVLWRRLGMGRDECLGLRALEQTAELMSELMGWPAETKEKHITRYRRYIQNHFKPRREDACGAREEN